jgi:hypothetical protein
MMLSAGRCPALEAIRGQRRPELPGQTTDRGMRGETYCDRCDLLVGLPGLHVIKVVAVKAGGGLTVTVESPPEPTGCPICGVIAASHGRRAVVLVDAPCFGRPVRVAWRKDERICRLKGLLTVRVCWWAISQLRAASSGAMLRHTVTR